MWQHDVRRMLRRVVYAVFGHHPLGLVVVIANGVPGCAPVPGSCSRLRRIAAMYAIEKENRGELPEVRLAVRQTRTAPLVEDFGVWLRRQRARVSPKSRPGEKLAYIGNHREGLRVLLTGGRVEMDANIVENAIRPLALNRKNALFAGHDEGAAA